MSRLSIFSSKTLQLGPVRGLFFTLVATLTLYILLDAILRMISPVQLYGGWSHPELYAKIEGARQWHRKHGRLDLLLLSSSLGYQVDVGQWQQATNNKVICYDAAVGGQRPQHSRLLFENVYYPQLKPRHVLYCLSPRDVNAMSKPQSAWHHYGFQWGTVQGRRFSAESPAEHALSLIERMSYIVQARSHARTIIQKGFPREAAVPFASPDGVASPELGKLPEKNLSAAQYQKILPTSPYGRFSMPDWGELGELIQLAKFCKVRNVGFTVINYPVPPIAHGDFHDFKKDYATYLNGLDKLRDEGVEIIDAAAALKLPNSCFYDHSHINVTGRQKLTDYIYQHGIKKLFPREAIADSLPEIAIVPLYPFVENDNDKCFVSNYSIYGSGAFMSPYQVVAQQSGAQIDVSARIPMGNYTAYLAYGDERTTRTPDGPPHKASIIAGDVEYELEVGRDRGRAAGTSKFNLELPTTSTLQVKVGKLSGKECVLDSIILQPHPLSNVSSGDLAQLVETIHNRDVAEPGNYSFEFRNTHYPGPAEWLPYTRERAPWGAVELDPDSHSGRYSVRLAWDGKSGWGSVITHTIDEKRLAAWRGKEIQVSIWVKSKSPRVYARIEHQPPRTSTEFSKYNGNGEWQQIQAQVPFETQTLGCRILIGSLSKNPVWFDDLQIQVK